MQAWPTGGHVAVTGQIGVETAGWQRIGGQAETELRFEGDLPVGPGSSEVHDTTRTDPLVRSLERRTLADLRAGITQATATIRPAQVRATPTRPITAESGTSRGDSSSSNRSDKKKSVAALR